MEMAYLLALLREARLRQVVCVLYHHDWANVTSACPCQVEGYLKGAA
jgi:hypothetical protein